MHIVVPKSALLDLLAPAVAACEARSTTPILGAVLLEARSDGTLTATATNKAVTFTGSAIVDVRAPGAVCIDAATLMQVVKTRDDKAPLDIRAAENQRVIVKAGRSESKLVSFAPADFPVAPELKDPRETTVDAGDLARCIDQMGFAIAPEDNRYGLNGAHVEKSGEKARFVSTDGNRLAWAEIPFAGELAPGRKLLVPRGALMQIRALLTKVAGPVAIRWGERACQFVAPSRRLDIRMLEAEFPDYRQVIPAGFKRKATLDRAEFAAAIEATQIFAVDGAHSIRFEFDGESCRLSARKLDAGDARTEVGANLDGERISLGMNARFVLDVLKALRGDTVTLEMGDVLSPIVVRDPADAGCFFVVMPVRLD